MSKITWDDTGTRRYETGVSNGVLYLQDGSGAYSTGVGWNGLTKVTEKPTGASASPQYADNIKYLNLLSAEQFECTVEAFTYPDEFGQCDGTASPEAGVFIGQQTRKTFGLSYKTLVGDDVNATDAGFKLHLVYGCLAAPSEKDYETVNDSPTAISFSWDVTTTPVNVTGFKPTATLEFDSTKVDAGALATLMDFLYGTTGTDPSLPMPDAVLAIFSGTVTVATPTEPTYDSGTHTITIPTVTGLTYYINSLPVTGTKVIAADTVVTVRPNSGYKLPDVSVDRWFYSFS
jgi:hypothetical protein